MTGGDTAPMSVMTVGHSTRSLEEFLDLLRAHGVTLVVDVRTAPGSRRHPQFGRDTLPEALRAAGIDYRHLPGLGGWRRARPDSPNTGWRSAGFRGYADYMLTPGLEAGLQTLIALAREQRVAVMCAEAVPWRCHRSLIADALVVRGVAVEHILSATRRDPHALTPWARVTGTRLTYPAPAPGDGENRTLPLGPAADPPRRGEPPPEAEN
jgi:uncharacterized protein (DUF488 family)